MNIGAITDLMRPEGIDRAPAARTGPSDRYDDAQRAAEQLVASVLVQPILAAVRESAGSGPFGSGLGEQRMGPLLDQKIADQIVRAAGWPLVDRVRERVAASAIEVRG